MVEFLQEWGGDITVGIIALLAITLSHILLGEYGFLGDLVIGFILFVLWSCGVFD